MKHAVPITLVLFVLVTVPMSAQGRFFDLTGYASWVDTSSEGTFDEDSADPIDINFDGTLGYGIAANIFFGERISTEFAIMRVENDVQFRQRAVANANADTQAELMPITGVLQFHFIPNGAIDPYVGVGAAYVLIDDVDAPDELNNIDFESIDFDDDVGLAVNAGLGIRLTNNFGLTLDAKYVPLESSARAVSTVGEQDVTFDMNPVILSAGLSLRF